MSNRSLSTRKIADVDVSVLCLGTMTFGNPMGRDGAIRIIHWALNHGINFIDTADMCEGYDRYMGSPGGVAETILVVGVKRIDQLHQVFSACVCESAYFPAGKSSE